MYALGDGARASDDHDAVGKDQPCKSAAQEVVTAWGQTDAKPGQAGQKTGGHLPVSLPD